MCSPCSRWRSHIAASSAYADAAGLVARAVAPGHVARLRSFREDTPAVSRTLVFVLGAVLGSYPSASTGGELTGTLGLVAGSYAYARWEPDLLAELDG